MLKNEKKNQLCFRERFQSGFLERKYSRDISEESHFCCLKHSTGKERLLRKTLHQPISVVEEFRWSQLGTNLHQKKF
jgi:hypothetical protein